MSHRALVATAVGACDLDILARAIGNHAICQRARLLLVATATVAALAGSLEVGAVFYAPMIGFAIWSLASIKTLARHAPDTRAQTLAVRGRFLAFAVVVVDTVGAPIVGKTLLCLESADYPYSWMDYDSAAYAWMGYNSTTATATLGTLVVGALCVYTIAGLAVARSLHALVAFVGDTALVDSFDRHIKWTVATLLFLLIIGAAQTRHEVCAFLWLIAIPPFAVASTRHSSLLFKARASLVAR